MSKVIPYGQAISVYRDTECSLCLEEFSENDLIQVLACEHIFHAECLEEIQRETCSLCNARITEIPTDGFYHYLYHFLIQRLPNNGAWDAEEIFQFSLELREKIKQTPEWTHFVVIKKFRELKSLVNPNRIKEKRSASIWKEALFKDFRKHPEIKSLFAEIAQRHLTAHEERLKESTLLERLKIQLQLSDSEKNTLKKAKKLTRTTSATENSFWQLIPKIRVDNPFWYLPEQ